MKKLLVTILALTTMGAFAADGTLNVSGTPIEGIQVDCSTNDLDMGTYSRQGGAFDADDVADVGATSNRTEFGAVRGERGECTITAAAAVSLTLSTAAATLTNGTDAQEINVDLNTEDAAGAPLTTITTDAGGSALIYVDGFIGGGEGLADELHSGTGTVTAVATP